MILNNLSDRQIGILKELYNKTLPVSLEKLIDTFSVSKRTIQYDIAEIKRHLKENYEIDVHIRRGKGYYIRPKDKDRLINLLKIEDDNLSNRLIDLMILIALSADNLTVEDIAEKMYFSSSSIRNLIKEFNEAVNLLEIKINNDRYISLENDELTIKTVISETLTNAYFNDNKQVDLNILFDSLFIYIEKEKIEKVIKLINYTNEKYNVWISKYAYVSIVNYLMITFIRKEKTDKIYGSSLRNTKLEKEYKYSEEIIEKMLGYSNELEIIDFMNFIISKGIFIDSFNENNLKFTSTIRKMLEYLKSIKNVSFDYEALEEDISRHLYQFLKRKEIGYIDAENPLLQDIKMNYASYFNLAAEIYAIFAKEMGLDESPSETSYIAIYLYKNHKDKCLKKYRVITVCGTGRGLAKLLQIRIENTFSNIEVVKNLSSHYFIDKSNFEDIDFIISTVNLPSVEKDVIRVSSILNKNDIRKIRDYIDYGEMHTSVPLRSNDDSDINHEISDIKFSRIYSDIFLRLYDAMLEIPEEYEINEEKMLGVTIHLILSIPRILENVEDENEEFIYELQKIERSDIKVSNIMNEFFEYVESILNVRMIAQEKYAYYQYIIKKE